MKYLKAYIKLKNPRFRGNYFLKKVKNSYFWNPIRPGNTIIIYNSIYKNKGYYLNLHYKNKTILLAEKKKQIKNPLGSYQTILLDPPLNKNKKKVTIKVFKAKKKNFVKKGPFPNKTKNPDKNKTIKVKREGNT